MNKYMSQYYFNQNNKDKLGIVDLETAKKLKEKDLKIDSAFKYVVCDEKEIVIDKRYQMVEKNGDSLTVYDITHTNIFPIETIITKGDFWSFDAPTSEEICIQKKVNLANKIAEDFIKDNA